MLTLSCTKMQSLVQTQFSSGISLDRKARFLSPCSKFGSQVGKLNNSGFHLVLAAFIGRRVPCRRQRNSRGVALKCLIIIPGPNEHSPLYTATAIAEGGELPKEAVPQNATENFGRGPVKAAFFDVDGTITRTNVVMAYFCVRMAELMFFRKLVWLPWFVLSCIVYLIVDHFHRPTFNRIFYSSYKGRSTDEKTAMAKLVFENYYKPRIMAGAAEQMLKLKRLGYRIVLVTGALDFLIAPLGQELGADFVYAAKLVEENGRFTGGVQGLSNGNYEKAERILDYAKRHEVSLGDSLAFGDSIADVPMLEVVGRPYAVNPDARLQSIALKRGWGILNWKTIEKQESYKRMGDSQIANL